VSGRPAADRPAVPVTWSGRNVVLTAAFKALVEHKIARLTRVLPEVLDARMVCTGEKFRRTVRVTLRARRGTFASEATAAELAVAFDAAVEALKRQTREAKERRTVSKGRAARRVGIAGPVA
jgi:ribosomal subunit interface protein